MKVLAKILGLIIGAILLLAATTFETLEKLMEDDDASYGD